MPEQISKYPEVTLKVLQGAGARCGERVKPKILTRCPPERFCSLPTGEICVYGIKEIPQMTQIRTEELARVVCPPPQSASLSLPSISSGEAVLFGLAVVVGYLVRGLHHRQETGQAD